MNIEFDSTTADFANYQNDMRELADEGYFDSPDEELDDDRIPGEEMDGDFDSAMASAGFGTDEDYEHHDIDSFYEDRFDIGDE
jgi:hypothetical protein